MDIIWYFSGGAGQVTVLISRSVINTCTSVSAGNVAGQARAQMFLGAGAPAKNKKRAPTGKFIYEIKKNSKIFNLFILLPQSVRT